MSKRRKRFADKSKAGNSKVVGYKSWESWRDRHARRLDIAMGEVGMAKEWCEVRGIQLRVSNNNHHWKFIAGEKLIEWWPSSAKLVIGKRYRHGIHVHDFGQVQGILTEKLLGK